MRLWHYKLIPVLPNKMLVSQWRECIAVKRQWRKETLKHRLVSYVIDYNKAIFYEYTLKVRDEMIKRNIKFKDKYIDEIWRYCFPKGYAIAGLENYPEHNDRYLAQCYFNLQEKYDRGIISQQEWQKIDDLINEVLFK